MLELAKLDTFHLDDRLCPYSREDLRAESWLQGFMFAKRHQNAAEENDAPVPSDIQWTKEDREMVGFLINHFEKDLEELRSDRYGHQEIVSDLKESCREKIMWLERLQERMGKDDEQNKE